MGLTADLPHPLLVAPMRGSSPPRSVRTVGELINALAWAQNTAPLGQALVSRGCSNDATPHAPWSEQWPVVLDALRRGEIARVRPPGRSMEPLIYSRAEVTIAPLGERAPAVGDIVFCRVVDRWYIHKVMEVRGDEAKIGNNKGGVNGWIGLAQVYGVVTGVDNG